MILNIERGLQCFSIFCSQRFSKEFRFIWCLLHGTTFCNVKWLWKSSLLFMPALRLTAYLS